MHSKVLAIVDSLLASYRNIGGINHVEGSNLPSRLAVREIAHLAESLIFPGFRDETPMSNQDLPYVTAERLNRLANLLSGEIGKALCFGRRLHDASYCLHTGGDPAHQGCKTDAETISLAVLQKLPDLRSLANADVAAAFAGDPAAKSTEEVILAYPGLEALVVHRFAHELWTRKVPLIPRMLGEYLHSRTGIDIHPGASIGPGLFIDHGTGVVIGETSIIGANVKMYQGVTLGALSVKKEESDVKRHPTIEDNVTIYAGATILGGQTIIGAGSTIGGNVWLTESVPPNTVVYNRPGDYLRKSAPHS